MPSETSGSGNKPASGRGTAAVWWGLLSLTVPLLTGLLLSWHSLGDLDIWFHLRAGRDLLDGQGVVHVNRYSFTEPDHPWVNHEWMFQVLAAVTGPDTATTDGAGEDPDVFGWNALRATLALLIMLMIMLGDGGRARLSGREGAAAAAWAGVPVLAGLLLLWPRLTLRPELFSYLFFIVVIRETGRFFRKRPPSAANRWSSLVDPRGPAGRIVLVSLLWAQFHGFAVLAPLLVLLGWLLSPLQSRLRHSGNQETSRGPAASRAVILVLLSLLALVLTPNGLSGLMMPVRALGQFSQAKVDLRTTVSELVPLQDTPNSLGLTIALYRASLVCGLAWIVATFGRVPLLRIVVFLLAAGAAWTNQRSIGFHGLAFILLFTGAGPRPWRFGYPARLPAPPLLLTTGLGLAVTLLAVGLLWPQIVGNDFYLREGVGRRFGSGVNPARYPTGAAAYLKTAGDLPCFANLDAAAFLLAHTSAPLFIDGRTEAYSADLWAEYLAIKKGDERALSALETGKVGAVCLAIGGGSFDRLASALLGSGAWRLTTAEGAGLLFQRRADGTGDTPRTTEGGSNALLEAAASRSLIRADSGDPARQADNCLAAGRLFRFADDEAGQERAYRRGLALRPDHPALNHNLGNILLGRGKFEDALPLFRAALARNPRLAGSALNAGVCLMRLGQPVAAVGSFGRAVGINPRSVEAWVNLAAARFGSGDRNGAVQAMEKALELRPGDRRLEQRLREWKRGTV